MGLAEFHANIWANVIGGLIFVGIVWTWVRSHGGHCPVCNQPVP